MDSLRHISSINYSAHIEYRIMCSSVRKEVADSLISVSHLIESVDDPTAAFIPAYLLEVHSIVQNNLWFCSIFDIR
jgi:hypothetical protein